MTTGIERAVLWAGVLAYFAATLAWIGSPSSALPEEREQVFSAGSVFNSSPRGLSLAHGYLRGRAGQPGGPRRVDLLQRPLGRHLAPADATVLRVRPSSGPALLLSAIERDWVSAGGRLVVAVAGKYGPLSVATSAASAVEKVFPAWPGVARIEPPARRTLEAGIPLEAHTLLALGDQAALVRQQIGQGELLLLAIPELIENGALERADHLRLLEAMAGERRAVYFDEHVHGLEAKPGVLDLLSGWGFGPALVLLVLAGALALWREKRRLGPQEDDHRERRTEAVDLLDSLADLYDRALSPAQALRLYRHGLERAVSAATGLKGDALERRLAELSGSAVGGAAEPGAGTRPAGPEGGTFARALAAINDGYRRLHGTR